jgi:Tfp pilus assembly protein PilF
VASQIDLAQRHLSAGIAQLVAGDNDAARASLIEAVTLAPQSANAHFHLARAHAVLGARSLAEQSARTAISLDPNHAAAVHGLGAMLAERGDAAQATPWLRRAAELAPQSAKVFRDLGSILVFTGELDEARAALMRAFEIDPHADEAIDTLVRLQPMDADTPEVTALLAVLEQLAGALDRLQPESRSQVLFSMAKALEDRGEHDRAFASLAKANAIRRETLSFDIKAAERRMEHIAQTFDAPHLEWLKGCGHDSDRPIFIVGMPRSGTTLVEQIISAHPLVHGAGEIPLLSNWLAASRGKGEAPYPDWARTMTDADCRNIGQIYLNALPAIEPPKRRITDKWVDNFEHLGLIHACLPNAVIIHCQRDPRDTCLSCFGIRFVNGQQYSYDLAELGRYWRAYERLMAHWRAVLPPGRMLEAPYEAVVDDVEGWARRLIAHCGLEWDDACLRFYESKRQVYSASFAQVRQPIYTGSVGRWRPFARHLGPLLDALGPPWDSPNVP